MLQMDIVDTPKFNKREYNTAYIEANKEKYYKSRVKEIWNVITQIKSSAKKII